MRGYPLSKTMPFRARVAKLADAPDFDTSGSSPTTQTLSCDWPRAVLASTISNPHKRKLRKVKSDGANIRPERPQGPLCDLERRELYLREGERLAHMGSWSLRAD